VKSHQYQVRPKDWSRAVLPTAAVVAALLGLIKAGNCLDFLPRPNPTSEPTTVVLAHQSRAARSYSPAEVVLVGDSTCMADVDPITLSKYLPREPEVINLGLLIWFGFDAYAEVLSDFVVANPGQVRVAVLLVTPQKLSMAPSEAGNQRWWRQIRLADGDSLASLPPRENPAADRDFRSLLRQNILSHVLATPLRAPGSGAARFGFSCEIDRYMSAHHGNVLHFGNVQRPRRVQSPNLRLEPSLESECRIFRSKIPPGVKLFVGLSPIAQCYSSPLDRSQRGEMLSKWSSWLKADAILTNLPPSLPDVFFADKTHLNEAGQKRFTMLLGSQLAALVSDLPEMNSPPVIRTQELKDL